MTRMITEQELRETLSEVLDQASRRGEALLVTRDDGTTVRLNLEPGRPNRDGAGLYGLHKGLVHILGDVVNPLDTDDWGELASSPDAVR